jgi:hypothetical protein
MPESRIELDEEMGIYLGQINTCIHEAAHGCGALHVGVGLQYIEIGLDDISFGRVMTPTQILSDGRIAYPERRAFVSACGIAAAQVYHLRRGGTGHDLTKVREWLASIEDADKIERKILWKARQFVAKHKSRIFKVAHALQLQKRLDGQTTNRIFCGTEEVIVPRKFLDAVGMMQSVRWVDTYLGLRAFKYPVEHSTN